MKKQLFLFSQEPFEVVSIYLFCSTRMCWWNRLYQKTLTDSALREASLASRMVDSTSKKLGSWTHSSIMIYSEFHPWYRETIIFTLHFSLYYCFLHGSANE